jgi:NADH-quinone oxidoreductase subunit G
MDLARVEEQWPIIGRADLYYGGTSYDNHQGLGVQLPLGGSPSLGWIEPPVVERAAEGMLAVPVTRLYDQGRTLLPSTLIQERTGEAFVGLNPQDAQRMGVQAGGRVQVSLPGSEALIAARIDEGVPEGVVLVPRSFGIPISGPVPARVKLAETVAAD